MSELPEGWISLPLTQAFDLNPSKPARDALPASSSVTFVPMQAVDATKGAIVAPEERPYGEVRKGYTAFAEGDVIMAKITPCFENGKTAIARGLKQHLGFGSTEFHVFRSTGLVLAEYLFHHLRQDHFRDAAAENMTGTAGQARVPAEYLKGLSLPIPPLAEQRRIVAKVEALLSLASATKERLTRVSLLLKRFRQSALAAAFSGRLSEDWRQSHKFKRSTKGPIRNRTPSINQNHDFPEQWNIMNLNEITSIIDPNPSHRYPAYTNGTIPLLATREFDGLDGWKVDGAPLVPEEVYQDQYRACHFDRNDIIFARKGRLGLARRPPPIDRYAFSHTVFVIKTNEYADSGYVLWYLRKEESIHWITAEMNSNTGVPTLGKSVLARLPIALPSLEEQRYITNRLQSIFAIADLIEKRVIAAMARADKLPQSILAKAFAGELVPTEAELARAEGRSYESAEELLARVRNVAPAPPPRAPRGTGAVPRQRRRGSSARGANDGRRCDP